MLFFPSIETSPTSRPGLQPLLQALGAAVRIRGAIRIGGFARVFVIMGWLAVATAIPTVAQDRGTQADQDACTPDVFRLCSDFIPDEPPILRCLEAKRALLTPACAHVIGPAPETKPIAHVRSARRHH